MKIFLIGLNGKMGQTVQAVLAKENIDFCGIDLNNRNEKCSDCDVILDFSSALSLKENLLLAKENNLPIVIATTGHDESNLKLLQQMKEHIPIFLSSNFSILFNIFLKCLDNFANLGFCDFVVEESHHKHKKDSPSGSCKDILKKLDEQKINYTVHCNRVGDVIGEHKLRIFGENEILEISHTALSREVFARGALKACKYILNKPNGLYTMKNLI